MGGVDEAAHLALARKFGAIKDQDPANDDPGFFRHVWMWFHELCDTRQIEGMSGLHQPISNVEILAWSELNAQPIAAHEYRLLRALDRIFLKEERKAAMARSKQQQAEAKTKGKR